MKTKLGVSVGLLGAALYLAGLFMGTITLILLAGYVLLFESNEWLRKTAVKACVIYLSFSILLGLIGFIPDLINLVNSLCVIFDGVFSINVLRNIAYFAQNVLSLAEKVLFLVLAFLAIKQGSITVPVVDEFVNKHTKSE